MENDLIKIANVHIRCFPNSFSTALGEELLANFYREYLQTTPELFFVLIDEGEICGFCMGYSGEKGNCNSQFLKHNIGKLVAKCIYFTLTWNRQFIEKCKKISRRKKKTPVGLDYKIDFFSPAEVGDLLSICVLPEYRGTGAASMMMKCFLNELIQMKCKFCLLTVDSLNMRGREFYKKSGFTIYRELGDSEAITYAKRL